MACYAFALNHCQESGPLADFFPPKARTLMASFLADNRPGGRQMVPRTVRLLQPHLLTLIPGRSPSMERTLSSRPSPVSRHVLPRSRRPARVDLGFTSQM